MRLHIKILTTTLLFVSQFLINSASYAQDNYPNKPIRIVVAYPAAGSTDVIARLFGQELSAKLGQPVVIDNKAGAGTLIGTEFVIRAAPDGYTLMQAGMPLAANMSLYKNLSYELSRDFTAVSQLVQSPNMLVVHPSLPVKSVKELIALAKVKPGAINYSSSGAGSTIYLSFEFFKGMAGIDIVHVPYRGGAEAVTAIVSGETSVSFLPLATALPQTRQGRLRALAVSTAKRVPSLPEYPTLAEAGVPGFEFGTWYGVMAPAKTPREIIAVLQAATVASLRNPEVLRRLNDLGYITVGDTPEVFQAYVKSEVERLGKLIRAYKLAVDG